MHYFLTLLVLEFKGSDKHTKAGGETQGCRHAAAATVQPGKRGQTHLLTDHIHKNVTKHM